MARHRSDPPPVLDGAIVLAGGRGTRLGGTHKPAIPLAGRPLVGRLLDVFDDIATVVVGLPDGVPDELRSRITVTREHPPGGGPVAALAEGVRCFGPKTALVAVAAADMPFLTRGHFDRLVDSLGEHDAAVPTTDGRCQWLASVWRLDGLRRALGAIGDPANQAVRTLAAPLDVQFAPMTRPDELRELFDIDTPNDLDEARRMTNDGR